MNAMKMKKLAATILTTATMAIFNTNANAITISVSADSKNIIAGQTLNVTITTGNENDQSSGKVTIQEGEKVVETIKNISVSATSIPVSNIAKDAKVCIDAGTYGKACSEQTFTSRPDSFAFKLSKDKNETEYGNKEFSEGNDLSKDPFAGQKVYLEVTPLDVNGKEISNTCDEDRIPDLNLKLSGTINQENGGGTTFAADNSKFQFLNNGVAENCEHNKLYIPFRFLDFGLLTLTENSFSSDFTTEKITNKTDNKLGIFKAAYVYFVGKLKVKQEATTDKKTENGEEVITNPALTYMGQPFDIDLTYTAYPQPYPHTKETSIVSKPLESYTYNENNKNYMFNVGLLKSYDNEGNYDFDRTKNSKPDGKPNAIIAGNDLADETIYGKLLESSDWKDGTIVFNNTDEQGKSRCIDEEGKNNCQLRYKRPPKPKEPQIVSLFGGYLEGPEQAQVPDPQSPPIATKGEADGLSVYFGRLRFTDIMHYDKNKLIVKIIPQKWENSTWRDAGDEHTKDLINGNYFKTYNDKAHYKDSTLPSPLFKLEKFKKEGGGDDYVQTNWNGILELQLTPNASKKTETYVCVNLGGLAENGDLNDDKDVCTTGVTPANVPWLKGIWKVTETETETKTKYNQNPRAHVYYGLKYSAEKEKTVYTRELW